MHQYKQSSRYRVTRGKLTSSEWVVLSMLASGGEGRGGRHSIPLCWPLHYQWRLGLLSTAFVNDAFIKGRAVPCPPTRPHPQRSRDLSSCDFFFLMGILEIACLHSQTPYVEWFEGSHPSGNSSDRSSVVGPCLGRFKKRLENCIEEDGRHLTSTIFNPLAPNDIYTYIYIQGVSRL